ncbi:MAG: hypothetical protein ACOYY2_03990 [Actinomycetota bacterium]
MPKVHRIGHHDLAALARKYRRLGWDVTYNKSTHLVWTKPCGCCSVRTAGTPRTSGLRQALARVRALEERPCPNTR